MTSMPRISPLIALVACLFTPLGWAQSQGVGKTEISLGSIQDLSGPLAGFGKQVRLGMLLPPCSLSSSTAKAGHVVGGR